MMMMNTEALDVFLCIVCLSYTLFTISPPFVSCRLVSEKKLLPSVVLICRQYFIIAETEYCSYLADLYVAVGNVLEDWKQSLKTFMRT